MPERLSSEEWNRLREENTSSLRAAVETLENRLETEDFQQIWNCVKELRELFKLKPLDRDEQPNLWERFRKVCAALEEIQQENIAEVESALAHLNREHPLSYLDEMATSANRLMGFDRIFGMDNRVDFGAIWRVANQVGNLLHEKALMPPRERQRLRDELNAYRDKLHEFGEMHQRRHEDDCNDNRNEISNALDAMENLVGSRDFHEQRKKPPNC